MDLSTIHKIVSEFFLAKRYQTIFSLPDSNVTTISFFTLYYLTNPEAEFYTTRSEVDKTRAANYLKVKDFLD